MWVLVIEDEVSMGDLLRQGLEEDNHTVTLARDGLEGLHAAETCAVDVIVLDVMLPGLNGIDLARRLRSTGLQVPMLMPTARDAAADIVKVLDAGADDYLTKPFPLQVMLARLRALSRRAVRPTSPTLSVSDLTLDPTTRQATRSGHPLDLTSTELRLLEFLMRRAGRACSRAAIIDGCGDWSRTCRRIPWTCSFVCCAGRSRARGGRRSSAPFVDSDTSCEMSREAFLHPASPRDRERRDPRRHLYGNRGGNLAGDSGRHP